MSHEVKNEIKLFLFYLSIAIVSDIMGFILSLSLPQTEGEFVNAINMNEAWKHYSPMWLLFFVIGGMMRLIFVGFFKKR